jgi:hypothetical protein
VPDPCAGDARHADDEEAWFTRHFDTGEPITVTKLPVL